MSGENLTTETTQYDNSNDISSKDLENAVNNQPSENTDPEKIDLDQESTAQAGSPAEGFDTPNPEDYDYYSIRDLDGDGENDSIVTRKDDITETHHLEDDQVVSIEADLNDDGIAETLATVHDENTIRLIQDTTLDGTSDREVFIDKATGKTIEEINYTENGAASVLADTDGDGIVDLEIQDTDGDGVMDTIAVDSDADGHVNSIYRDVDGDGTIDQLDTDLDNTDGILETTLTTDNLDAGNLGTVDEFMSQLPIHGADALSQEMPDSDYTSDLADSGSLGTDDCDIDL
ncbi:hypothetical protein [Corynebacterium aquilae]|uniref:hypothetical protein n=1 Tax=Corynebacterium aquilae TaxID=203263 RepID=UPI0009510659|nr:hypothetical protein [Corynebacterium aquilae]